jgi:hypothetical protein
MGIPSDSNDHLRKLLPTPDGPVVASSYSSSESRPVDTHTAAFHFASRIGSCSSSRLTCLVIGKANEARWPMKLDDHRRASSIRKGVKRCGPGAKVKRTPHARFGNRRIRSDSETTIQNSWIVYILASLVRPRGTERKVIVKCCLTGAGRKDQRLLLNDTSMNTLRNCRSLKES